MIPQPGRQCYGRMMARTFSTAQRTHGPASPRRLTRGEVTLDLNERGALRLAIVADTHSHPHPNLARWLEALAPDAIVHAGDIGDVAVLSDLTRHAPVIAVRGNIDDRASHLPDVMTIDIRSGNSSVMKMLLVHIAVYGAKLRADAAKLAADAGASLVICGHSHVPFVGRDRGLTVFNPGSIGPRRMHLPIVFGVLEIQSGKLSLRHVDAGTGQDWNP